MYINIEKHEQINKMWSKRSSFDNKELCSDLKGFRGGGGTTRVILSYVLSRIGQIRSVDRVRGCWLYGSQNRGGRRRRSRISVEGIVDQSRLRNTLAAVPESARRRAHYLRGGSIVDDHARFVSSRVPRDEIAIRTTRFESSVRNRYTRRLVLLYFFPSRVSQRVGGEDEFEKEVLKREFSRHEIEREHYGF